MKVHLVEELIKLKLSTLVYLIPEIFLLINVLFLTLYLSFGFGRYMHNYIFRVSYIFVTLTLFFAFILAVYLSSELSLTDPVYIFKDTFNMIIFNGYLAFNNYVLFFRPLIIFMAFLCCLLSYSYYMTSNSRSFEYPLLIAVATIGSSLLISAFDLMSFYLSMELTSFCLYTLAASRYNSFYSVEAGIKYFVQGCSAAAFYVFGSALFFVISGSTNFFDIRESLGRFFSRVVSGEVVTPLETIFFVLAITFTSILVLFKVAIVPYHYWIADVYEGSPMSVTAFFSIVIKLTMSVVLIRFLFTIFEYVVIFLNYVFLIYGLLSVIIGALSALTAQKIKRIFAFSSISHSGYILLALLPGTSIAIQSSLSYLIVYIITNIVIFAFLLICTTVKQGITNRYLVYITDLSLLQRENLTLSSCFAIALLSFAGIPPFGGFLVKFDIFTELWNSGYHLTVILLILTSLISTFYYLRFIKCLFFSPNVKSVFIICKNNWNTLFILLATYFLVFYPFLSNALNAFLIKLSPTIV